jgi:hypothetical protein
MLDKATVSGARALYKYDADRSRAKKEAFLSAGSAVSALNVITPSSSRDQSR